MSEIMTTIDLPGIRDSGYAEYGRKTVQEMIKIVRNRAVYQQQVAAAILAAPNEAFHIETHRGVHVWRDRKILQTGRK